MGLDPGAIQAVSAASGVWDDSNLIQARRNTQQWNENIKLEQQHLAAATPAGTSLVAIQRHVAVTLATWDAVLGEYLHSMWAEQRMRLYSKQKKVLERYFKMLEEEAAMVSQQRWRTRKQLVVFFGNAGIGTRAWSKRCKAPVRGLTWCSKLDQATPGDLGKWVDRDCNAAVNLQRAGEAKWRPLELCGWKHRAKLPAKDKEYQVLVFKKLRDRAPKAQPQPLQPVAQ
ncbi:hypothetical protein QJQ45_011415 [Haematococcus lacustris]|nr:hypothetical protein QJQ45_011415 [Haematococcus lacustris]